MRLGVCVSGQGTNLRNLFERGFEIVAVATNKTSCGGAAFARETGLPLGEFSQRRFETAEARDVAMRDFFNIQRVELVVDAGYDRVHTAPFVEAFAGRIINLHPSLLPEFGGAMDAIEQALRAGVKRTGVTVHIVTDHVDAGPIVIQEAVPIMPDDTLETLTQRVHEAEYRVLPAAIFKMESRLARPAVS
jgi:phosphoribosylglycinamide formyltransferase-1